MKKKHNIGPVLFFSGIVFCVMFAAMLIVVIGIFVLAKYRLFNNILYKISDNFSDAFFIVSLLAASSMIMGMVISGMVGKFAMKPLNKLIYAINKMAAGDYSVRLKLGNVTRAYPITQDLIDSFNKLASELENTEMLRTDFINNFSHEFKTPIVSIAGFAKMLKHGKLDEEQTKEYLEIIEKESMRLSSLATSILNLTKVENQTILTNKTCFNLSEQLRNCILMFENSWMEKNIELNLSLGEYKAFGNEELLNQVWINLIDNAVKYTPEFGMIEIIIEEKYDEIRVDIINTGKEISPKNYDMIFNKFFQEDKSHSVAGNGVGLAIVKKIVDLHCGKIDVMSKDGKTKFSVLLPIENKYRRKKKIRRIGRKK